MVTDMIAKGELDMTEAVANQPIARIGRADEIAASCCGCAARNRLHRRRRPTRGRRLDRALITLEPASPHQRPPQRPCSAEHHSGRRANIEDTERP